MEVGIESGCERILKLLKEKYDKVRNCGSDQTGQKRRYQSEGNFILACRPKQERVWKRRFSLQQALTSHFSSKHSLTIWLGAKLSVDASDYGQVETDWGKLAHFKISFIPRD